MIVKMGTVDAEVDRHKARIAQPLRKVPRSGRQYEYRRLFEKKN